MKSANFMSQIMTWTDLMLTGPDFINAPTLLLLDKRVQLLSTQATLVQRLHRIDSQRILSTTHASFSGVCDPRSCTCDVNNQHSAMAVLDVSRMPCVGSTRKWRRRRKLPANCSSAMPWSTRSVLEVVQLCWRTRGIDRMHSRRHVHVVLNTEKGTVQGGVADDTC